MVILPFYLECNVLCQLIHSVQLTQTKTLKPQWFQGFSLPKNRSLALFLALRRKKREPVQALARSKQDLFLFCNTSISRSGKKVNLRFRFLAGF